ncbi:hypothetical protein DEIPH_ctg052orf0025 [Deinococcus phoenicis]|uniref:Uncharacterized protein n=1 Tax=Deinococcus phoenicis TaxID=1476583 RepID=A0A016QMS8_9DEIO|nr:hypothetical protein [Deinococcus phoenicis]EYB67029.1 hypothetical protein DEIPH_ctg052orf0025 [Deinococcus phoenicis]
MTRFLTVHLATAAAKTWDEYLSDSDGDAAAAGKKARADLVERERQNSAARRFKQAYEGLVKKLNLSTDPEDAEAAASEANTAVNTLQTQAGSSGDAAKQLEAAQAALRDLGIDPAKLKEGVEAAKLKFSEADKAGKLEREVAYGKAAGALGFDSDRLQRVLRDERGLPELRKVKVKVKAEGGTESEQEQEVWGIAARDDKGTETGFTALADHADVKGFEAALKKADGPAPVTPSVPTTPVFVSQPATTSNVQPTLKVDAGAIAVGAGTV